MEELDDWFEQQKETLEKRYYASAKDERAKAAFDASYKNLVKAYQRKQERAYARQQRRERIAKPVNRALSWWGEAKKKPGSWIVAAKAKVKQRIFDFRFRHFINK